MIPKTIHYCWFGGNPLPKLAVKCINSWKKYCPDYVIKEWNENNFDVNCCSYVKEAFDAKKWAFITDYIRLYVMVNEGGVYMDTDVEVIASIDPFLKHKAFSGFEDAENIPTGIMACEKNFSLFTELLRDYDGRHFLMESGCYDLTTNVETITKLCHKHGFVGNNTRQNIDGFVLYPNDYFCPKSHDTGKITLTKKTVTIHHFAGSWVTKAGKTSAYIKGNTENRGFVIKCAGKIVAGPFTIISRIEREGIQSALRYYKKKCFGIKEGGEL